MRANESIQDEDCGATDVRWAEQGLEEDTARRVYFGAWIESPGTSLGFTPGEPIAVIKPIKNEQGLDAALERMAGDGLITLPSRKGPLPSPRWKPIRLKGKRLSQTIIDDREDRVHGS